MKHRLSYNDKRTIAIEFTVDHNDFVPATWNEQAGRYVECDINEAHRVMCSRCGKTYSWRARAWVRRHQWDHEKNDRRAEELRNTVTKYGAEIVKRAHDLDDDFTPVRRVAEELGITVDDVIEIQVDSSLVKPSVFRAIIREGREKEKTHDGVKIADEVRAEIEKKIGVSDSCRECGRQAVISDGLCWKCSEERENRNRRNRDDRYPI